jgi:hypothetical protein
MHDLQSTLNRLIAHDTRPLEQRNRHQILAGSKRTQITKAVVLAAPTAGAIPTQQITESDTILNSGPMIKGLYAAGPMTPQMVRQGQVGDCYLLSPILTLIYADPNFFDNIIYPVDSNTVVVQWYWSGSIIQIHCTTYVSTLYNNPGDSDIRVELAEKTYALLRSGLANQPDYQKLNMGSGQEAYLHLGLTVGTATKTPEAIGAALAAGKCVNFITSASAPTGWVGSHCYAIRSYVAATRTVIAQNPWYGGTDIQIDPNTLAGTWIYSSVFTGAKVNPPMLLAPVAPPVPPAPPTPPKPSIVPTLTLSASSLTATGAWNGMTVGWNATNAVSVTATIDGQPLAPVSTSADKVTWGELTFQMNSGGKAVSKRTITVTATSSDGTKATASAVCTLL